MFTMTVPPRHAAIRYVHGVVDRVLPAGRHRLRFGARHVLVDLRERLVPLAPQEVPAADTVPVRISATLRCTVTDPVAFTDVAQDPQAVVYLAAQLALREALSALTAEELTRRGARLPLAEITAQVNGVASTVGLTVTDVVVKDVLLPAEIRTAAMELVTARQRAAIQLEQARAETAALRSMANAAKLLDDHPALAQLRMIQAASSGTTLVLHLGGDQQEPPRAAVPS